MAVIIGEQKTKKALITGVCGQDGSYLAEFLLEKGYEVYGGYRQTMRGGNGKLSVETLLNDNFIAVPLDMGDLASIEGAMASIQPDEIYNLAAQSFVGESWKNPFITSDVNAIGALRIFEAARRFCPEARIYQASTSEMYGNHDGMANEKTKFIPRSPYGFSKVFAHNAAVNFRESYGMHISCGILFNHESPRRGPMFVTQKIIMSVKKTGRVALGNTDSIRDWGYAKEYVEAMWLMLQQEIPDDYVIATGQSHSVKDFLDEVKKLSPKMTLDIDPNFQRPAELFSLKADITKAKQKLKWQPKVLMPELVKIMWDAVE